MHSATPRETTSRNDRWIDVGRIGKPHGLKGEVVIQYYGDAPDRFAVGSDVSLLLRGERRTVKVVAVRPMPKKFVVRFEGCERIEDIELWRGGQLQVRVEDLPPLEEGSHYHYELIGLEVMAASGRSLGTLREILSTGSNDVYVVRGGDREYLIPAIEDAVEAVNLAAGKLILKDLKGLITS